MEKSDCVALVCIYEAYPEECSLLFRPIMGFINLQIKEICLVDVPVDRKKRNNHSSFQS